MWEVGECLKLDHQETNQVFDYLAGEGLVEAMALGGGISLTHLGVIEVEQAIEAPDKPTEHFLPVNVINIGTMSNSTLQQSTNHSTINFQVENSKLDDLDNILKSIKQLHDTLKIPAELKLEMISEIQTLEIQRHSPKPKGAIITEALKSLRTVLENVAGNAMTPIIVGQIQQMLANINAQSTLV